MQAKTKTKYIDAPLYIMNINYIYFPLYLTHYITKLSELTAIKEPFGFYLFFKTKKGNIL
jgi:hypothetical protein